MNNQVSRRDFLLASAAAGAAGIAASALAVTPAVADEVDEALVPTEFFDCDFVVAGTGTAGLCAATRAAELGAKVIVVDTVTENGVGGNSRYVENIGHIAVGTDNALEHVGAVETYYDALSAYHRYAGNQIVTRRFAETGDMVREWTTEFQGVTYNARGKYDHGPDEMSGGLNAILTMYELGKALGVQFIFDARAVKLLTNEEGAISGVVCKSRAGNVIQVNCKAVDLCTGGFSANPEMFERYTNIPYDRLIARGTMGTQMGDGLAMGLELGAQLHHPGAINYCSPILPGHYNKSALTVCGCNQADEIFVNQDGRRFCNEHVIRDWTLSGNVCCQQQHLYHIIDQDFVEKIMTEGVTTRRANYFEPGEPVPHFQEEIDAALERMNPRVVKADTLEELAEKLDIPADTFVAEIEKFNGFVDAGHDADFLKDPSLLRKVATPPFYGFKTVLAFYNNCGGLKVDEYARVIGKDFKPIPGLYAGGSDAGGLFGPYYDVSIAPGSTQLWGRVSGYWAADHAVTEYFPTIQA